MISKQRAVRLAGGFLLIATASFLIGDELIGAVVHAPDSVDTSYGLRQSIGMGVILQLIDCFAVIAIA